jgi:hypothetical protein
MFLAGFGLLLLGVLPSFGYKLGLFSVVIGDQQHDFVNIFYESNTSPFTMVSSDISTNVTLSNVYSDEMASAWVSVYAGSMTVYSEEEFMQIGYFITGEGDLALGFWASQGPVDNTGSIANVFCQVPSGSSQAYSIGFNGTGWMLSYDDSVVRYIAFPYPAYTVTLTEETASDLTSLGGHPDQVNDGIIGFSNAAVQVDWNETYPFFAVPSMGNMNIFGVNVDLPNMNGYLIQGLGQAETGWLLPDQTNIASYGGPYTSNPINPPVTHGPPYALSVSCVPAVGGTFSTLGGNYSTGFPVQVTETANAGFTFQAWYLDGAFYSESSSVSVIMDTDHVLTAYYTGSIPITVLNSTAYVNPSWLIAGGAGLMAVAVLVAMS